MYSVILCGGEGSRLWPLSRKNFPKQFLSLDGDKSFLQKTFLRMEKIMPVEKIFFITNTDHFYNVFNQIKELRPDFSKNQIIKEPVSLNTAPAIVLAAKHLKENVKIKSSEPIIFLPADHHIKDEQDFSNTVKLAAQKTSDRVGIIGIKPDKPSTELGYIKKGAKEKNCCKVLEFKEKPDKETAKQYIKSGLYLWNSGIYIFNTKTLSNELYSHANNIYSLFAREFNHFYTNFATLPSISIDKAISEKSKNLIMFEGDFGWSDIGSFDNLIEVFQKNDFNSRHINIDSENIFTYSTNGRLMATVGVKDLIIIENNDSILIQKKDYTGGSRKLAEFLKSNDSKERYHNLIAYRPWGKYEILAENDNYKTKKIIVYPGEKLSLQSHCHRSEHWVVVKGMAKVTHNDKIFILKENQSAFISPLDIHRLENPGKTNLEIIEVQTGNYLEEDDITRYSDDYERA